MPSKQNKLLFYPIFSIHFILWLLSEGRQHTHCVLTCFVSSMGFSAITFSYESALMVETYSTGWLALSLLQDLILWLHYTSGNLLTVSLSIGFVSFTDLKCLLVIVQWLYSTSRKLTRCVLTRFASVTGLSRYMFILLLSVYHFNMIRKERKMK